MFIRTNKFVNYKPCPPCHEVLLGEGDCDSDSECSGLLECGTDNCLTKTGGHWDPGDDCCQPRCDPSRQCGQGEGPCSGHGDCQTGGHYYVCSTDCLDRQHFPLGKYLTLSGQTTHSTKSKYLTLSGQTTLPTWQVSCTVWTDKTLFMSLTDFNVSGKFDIRG